MKTLTLAMMLSVLFNPNPAAAQSPAAIEATIPASARDQRVVVRARVLCRAPEGHLVKCPDAVAPAPDAAPTAAASTYSVQPGDTLGAIAASAGMDLSDLLALNPDLAAHPDSINVGDTVVLAAAPAEVEEDEDDDLLAIDDPWSTGPAPLAVADTVATATAPEYTPYVQVAAVGGSVGGLFAGHPALGGLHLAVEFPFGNSDWGLMPLGELADGNGDGAMATLGAVFTVRPMDGWLRFGVGGSAIGAVNTDLGGLRATGGGTGRVDLLLGGHGGKGAVLIGAGCTVGPHADGVVWACTGAAGWSM